MSTSAFISSANFALPTTLGSISIQNITGNYTYFTVTRTGGGLSDYTSSVLNYPTNSFTDPTTLNNNSMYVYIITPTNNSVVGNAFRGITNLFTNLPNGMIYTLASAPTLTYNGNGCSKNTISFTFTGGSYTNLSVQIPSGTLIAKTTVSPYTGGSFGVNTQNTCYVYAINGDNYGGLTAVGTGTNVTASSRSVNVCTWASAPTLTYNTAGSSISAISFTYSGGTFSSLSIQTTLGTQIDTSIVSPYTSTSIYSINQQITYYACPVNALGYYSTSTNYATVNVCTWASCNAPTFASTTSSGTTLTTTGTFSKVLINYSGAIITPVSGTTFTGTNTYTQAYTDMPTSTAYTFVCFPVNALNYQSSNSASAGVTTSAGAATFGIALFNSGGRISAIGTNTNSDTIGGWAISTGGKVVLYFIGNPNALANAGGTNQVYMNDGNFGTTFTNINSKLANFWTGAGGRVISIGVTNDGNTIVIFMWYTGTAGNTATQSGQPAWYVSTNGTSGSSGSTFTSYIGATGTVTFGIQVGQGQCTFSSDNQWCFATSYGGNGTQSVFRNTNASNFTAWTSYRFLSNNGPMTSIICLNTNASIMYCTGGWYGGTTLMKSTDTGVTWSNIASGVLLSGYATNWVGCDSTGNIVYCTLLWDGVSYRSRMFKSINAGLTWSEVTLPFVTTNWCSGFAIDSTGNNIVLLNGGGGGVNSNAGSGINPSSATGLYISTNGGTNWTTTTGYPTAYNPSYPSGIWADSTFTVFALNSSSQNGIPGAFGMVASFGQGRLF